MHQFLYSFNEFMSDHVVLQIILMYILPFIAFYSVFAPESENSFVNFLRLSAVVIYACFFLLSCSVKLFLPDDYTPPEPHGTTASRSFSPDFVGDYYRTVYPMTWGYIQKNHPSPYSYIITYDNIWGDLQDHHGDGIVFGTLTPYQQSLVNYPPIGNSVYFASSSSTTYHSIPYCYTLLGSNIMTRDSQYRYRYEPCSKCVGD